MVIEEFLPSEQHEYVTVALMIRDVFDDYALLVMPIEAIR